MTRVYLKLGSRCNLKCKYCHQKKRDYKVNEDVLEFLKGTNTLEHISIGGGEPLLYKNTIQLIVDSVKEMNNKITISFVSNGTCLTDDNIKWINDNKIAYGISYDGEDNLRGFTPDFSRVRLIENFTGVSTVVSAKFNYGDFYDDLKKAIDISGKNLLSLPNFIHQTKESENVDLVDKETVEKYICFVCKEMEYEYSLYKKGDAGFYSLPFIKLFTQTLNIIKTIPDNDGFKCCNKSMVHLTMEGDFMLCAYGDIKVGNIYKGIDWNLVNLYKPERCKKCDLWSVCRNTCIANITDNECMIFKSIYGYYKKLVGEEFAKQNI